MEHFTKALRNLEQHIEQAFEAQWNTTYRQRFIVELLQKGLPLTEATVEVQAEREVCFKAFRAGFLDVFRKWLETKEHVC